MKKKIGSGSTQSGYKMNAWDELKKQIEDTLGGIAGEPNADETKAEATKVLLPIVKRMLPNIIAADIVGVQPMVPKEMQIGFTDGIDHPYWVEPMASPASIFNYNAFDEKHQEQLDWCVETFNDEDWMASSYKFFFKEEKHRDWFVVRWS